MSARFDRYALESEEMSFEELIQATDFEVDWSPVHAVHEDGDPIEIPESFARALYRKDNSTVLGIHGARYYIRPYPTVLERLHACLKEIEIPGYGSGADFVKEARCRVGWAKGGARYKARITLPWEADIPHRGRKVGDVVKGEIVLRDSYDGGWSSGMGFGLLRLKCLNGQTAIEEVLGYSMKHTRHAGDVAIDMDRLQWAIGVMQSHFKMFDKQASALAELPVTPSQASLFFQTRLAGLPLKVAKEKNILEARDKFLQRREAGETAIHERIPQLPYNKGKVVELMTAFQDTLEEYEDEPTAFTVHNAMTRWSTHWPAKKAQDATIAVDQRDNRIFAVNRALLTQDESSGSAYLDLLRCGEPSWRKEYIEAGFDPELAVAA